MHSYDYALILAFFVLVLLPAPWLGRFYYKVMEGQRTWLTPVLGPVEKLCYRVAGVDPSSEQSWQKYTLALLAFNLAGFVMLFAIQPQPCLSEAGEGYLLFRIGDCVAQRNVHAAIYDALRLCRECE